MASHMAYQSETTPGSTSRAGADQDGHPTYHTGIGFTQWLALGLVALSIVMVILAIVMNFILGTPGA